MSLLWTIRITLIVILFAIIAGFGYFLKNREKYENIFENLGLNLLLVILYNALCYSIVGLPSDSNVISTPTIFENILIIIWFKVLGVILFVIGFLFLIITTMKRKKLGGQDTKGKLITKGVYSYCRHPIYLGIVLISVGIPLTLINLDGLIAFPLVFLANIIEAKFEEIFDVGMRFKEEYIIYKKQTRMFGPNWFWGALVIVLLLPLVLILII